MKARFKFNSEICFEIIGSYQLKSEFCPLKNALCWTQAKFEMKILLTLTDSLTAKKP